MNIAQHIGSIINAGFWIAVGVFVQFFLPGYIQKRIREGKEQPEAAERVRRNERFAGWLLILLGVVLLGRELLR